VYSHAQSEIRLLSRSDISDIVSHRYRDIIQIVATSYRDFYEKHSVCPPSLFFPLADTGNRFFALVGRTPSTIGTVCGCKWIGSYPTNLALGLSRASGVIILNDAETGYPIAIMEAALISALRTAASAILVAQRLVGGNFNTLGLVGIGPINLQVVRFALECLTGISDIYVTDTDRARLIRVGEMLSNRYSAIRFHLSSTENILSNCHVVSLATNQQKPHLSLRTRSLHATPKLMLHLSLRDIFPEDLGSVMNITDDRLHVCSADTSLALAVKQKSICVEDLVQLDECDSASFHQRQSGRRLIFHPFGLGVLDLSVASYVLGIAKEIEVGMEYPFNTPSA
jgi:ornithine cyclodeaminase/alanine dehydrogenase-like protein (mu-crystallin family)